jgi:glycosyltransferase involved in cell wall biosynthesis
LKVLVFPRDGNPYQRLLYQELPQYGVESGYLPAPTPSQTLNLILIPLSLLVCRLQGFRILHVHWVYLFAPPWVAAVPFGRRAMELWFAACLWSATALGYRTVWTAHNVLPHSQIFADDVAARRRLIKHAAAVVAHSPVTVPALEDLGARGVHVIQTGSFVSEYPQTMSRLEARAGLGLGAEDRVVCFVGLIEEYKGVDDLLEAARDLPDEVALRIVIAGNCRNAGLRRRLEDLARQAGDRVVTKFTYLAADELQIYLKSADVAVFPFRRITNSASVVLALSFGLPVLIPALPELAGIPDAIAIRYPQGGGATLSGALVEVASLDEAFLRSMGMRGRAYADSLSWSEAARSTADLYCSVTATS